jgi:Ring finger domain
VKCATTTQIWGADDQEDDAGDKSGQQQKDNPIDVCPQPTDTITISSSSSSSPSLTLEDSGCRTIPNGSDDCHLVVGATAVPTMDFNSGNKPCDVIAAEDNEEVEAIGDESSSSRTVAHMHRIDNDDDDDDENVVVGEQDNIKQTMAQEEADDQENENDGIVSLATISSLEADDLQRPACPICMEPFRHGDAVCLPNNERCNHSFHVECMKDWLVKHTRCPCCRELYLLEYSKTTTTTPTTVPPRQQ